MPTGISVATGGNGKGWGKNSSVLGIQIVGKTKEDMANKFSTYRANLTNEVLEKNKKLNA